MSDRKRAVRPRFKQLRVTHAEDYRRLHGFHGRRHAGARRTDRGSDQGFKFGGWVMPLGALIVHLNDAHHWTRERIAAWVTDSDVPQDDSHAHH